VFGYKGLVFATLAIAGLSMGVWAHHMFVTGAVVLPFFAGITMLIAVPTGVKFFNWIGTMWGGSIAFDTSMLFAVGFLLLFLIGGLTGPMLASPPIDFHLSDSYFVVAHFHYVLMGGSVFAVYSAIFYWFPSSRAGAERAAGQAQFWLMFVGQPHPCSTCSACRHAPPGGRLQPDAGFVHETSMSSLGSASRTSTLPFLERLAHPYAGPPPGRQVAHPWDGHTSRPRPRRRRPTTDALPIRSERPVWDLQPRTPGRGPTATASTRRRCCRRAVRRPGPTDPARRQGVDVSTPEAAPAPAGLGHIKGWPHETHVFRYGLTFFVIGTLCTSTGARPPASCCLRVDHPSLTYAVPPAHARPVRASIETQEEGASPNQLCLRAVPVARGHRRWRRAGARVGWALSAAGVILCCAASSLRGRGPPARAAPSRRLRQPASEAIADTALLPRPRRLWRARSGASG
jgi:hypothetical protein